MQDHGGLGRPKSDHQPYQYLSQTYFLTRGKERVAAYVIQ